MDYSKYFPIDEYYKRVVMPIDRHFYIKANKKMVCPLHDDKNPSMGIMNSSKGELYHCFGCGQTGNVVDLHKKISKKYFNKNLSDEEAVRDLCKIFGLDYQQFKKSEQKDEKNKRKVDYINFQRNMNSFSAADMRQMILQGKMNNKSIVYYNTLLITALDAEDKRKKAKLNRG